MTDNITPEEFELLVHKVLDERRTMDNSEHQEHHEWLKEHILCEQARRKRLEAITTAAIQWSVPAVMGAIYVYFKEYFH